MKAKRLPNQEDVYFALRNVFHGLQIDTLDRKTVRKLIEKNRKTAAIAKLIDDYTFSAVALTARMLVVERVFDSEQTARERFPRAFGQSTTRESTGMDSAATLLNPQEDRAEDSALWRLDAAAVTETGSPEEYANPETPGSSTVPIYLPFNVQHKVMVKMQATLEHVCYAFSQVAIPDVLRERGWTCAEAVQLNLWVDELLARPQLLKRPGNSGPDNIERSLRSVAKIRDVAVDRTPVTAQQIERFIRDAAILTESFGYTDCALAFRTIGLGIRPAIGYIEEESCKLQRDMQAKREAIRLLRVREESAIAAMEEHQRLLLKSAELDTQVITSTLESVAVAAANISTAPTEFKGTMGGGIDDDVDFCN